MQSYSSFDLRNTPYFAIQKNETYSKLQKPFNAQIHLSKTIKNSQFNSNFANSDYENTFHDSQSMEYPQSKQMVERRRLEVFETAPAANFNAKNSKFNVKFSCDQLQNSTKITDKDQENNIVSNTFSESLHIQSKIDEFQRSILQSQKKYQHYENIELVKNEHNNSNIEIDLNFGDQPSELDRPQKQRSPFKCLSVHKQIAITYMPHKNGLKKSSPFIKFHQSSSDKQDYFTSKSLISNQAYGHNNQLKDCMVKSTENFVKLHEIELFTKRKEIRIERSDELLIANEKLLVNYRAVKDQLEKTKKVMENLTADYQSKIRQVQAQLSQEHEIKLQIESERDAKQSILKDLKALNERFLKQNNSLKEKLKQSMKYIHELKYEISNKQTVEIVETIHNYKTTKGPNSSNKTIYVPLPTINSIPSNNEATERHQEPMRHKKTVTIEHHEGYEATSIRNVVVVEERKFPSQKLNNCISHTVLKGVNEHKLSANDIILEKDLQNACKNTRSQKSIGIKKNITTPQSLGSSKNFVKVNKNEANDNSMYVKLAEDRADRSISSYSNISGMSLSQKVGHVPRAPRQIKQGGILLDYMTEIPGRAVPAISKPERIKLKK